MKLLGPADFLGAHETSVVTVGNFDGVHIGHQTLIRKVVEHARARNGRSVVITFEPHTRATLYPELPLIILTTLEEKTTLIEELGVDYLMVIPFDRAFSGLGAEQFAKTFLVDKLHASEWIMGEGHSIGKDRLGGKKFLHDTIGRYHINIFAADLDKRDEVIVSSTQIRKLIFEGRIAEAVGMLGHPYLITAMRIEGIKLGTKLGFPTLNFKRPPSQKVIPPAGVYAAGLSCGDHTWAGALYFGECPTFTDRDVHFEFHSLTLEGTPPEVGEEAHLWLHKFIRADRSFPDAQELTAQIGRDIQEIKQYFNRST